MAEVQRWTAKNKASLCLINLPAELHSNWCCPTERYCAQRSAGMGRYLREGWRRLHL